MIEFQDVSVVYAKKYTALSHVSLRVEKGELVYLVGPIGAGKSTLLKLIYYEVVPTHGRVFVEGQNLSDLRPRDLPDLRRRIGVISPELGLLPDLTLFENVAFPLRVLGARSGKISKRVSTLLELIGLADRGDVFPHQVSAGERQQVALARALVHKPAILLADLSTVSLDSDVSMRITQILFHIQQAGTTILLTAHEAPAAGGPRPRIVELEQGHLVRNELQEGEVVG